MLKAPERIPKEVRDFKLQPVEIGHRQPFLEEPEKLKYFTGGSGLHHASIKSPQKQQKVEEKLTKSDVHTDTPAIQKESLEGKVDLLKVREIRRALRCKYANKKNVNKIFTSWDEGENGVLDITNVYSMLNKLGIKANLEEARVMVAQIVD